MEAYDKTMEALGIEHIDLLKVNIEGGEFDLLPHIVETGLIHKVDNLQIQFHNFIAGAESQRENIRRELEKTHTNNWCYTFVWENWVRKTEALD